MKCLPAFVFLAIYALSSFGLAQDKYAITIGAETYDPGTFQNLEYAEEDARELGKLLELYGFKTTIMTSRTESPRLRPSSVENIWNLVQARVRSCGENDTLIVSLSGHGIQFADGEEISPGVKETYFCPEDADLADKSTLLPISKLMALIDSSEAKRKLLLVDACRNEVISEAGQKKSSAKKLMVPSVHESRQVVPGGITVLFSCDERQFSWESEDLGRSVFSYYFTEYLRGAAPAATYSDGKMTLDGMILYVRKNTNDFVVDNNLSNEGQVPVLCGLTANWPIARLGLTVDQYFHCSDELLDAHAEKGIGDAQLTKAIRILERHPRTEAETALQLLEQAFKNECPTAGAVIASVHASGFPFNLKQDFEKAREWFQKAADQGDSHGIRGLGMSYMRGSGVEKDESEGIRYLKKSAKLGNVWAMSDLATAYERGTGVPVDEHKSKLYYDQILESTTEYDSHLLVQIAFQFDRGKFDPDLALRFNRRAAELGNTLALENLAEAYWKGEGVDVDRQAAIKWLRQSAEADDPTAMVILGELYLRGLELPKNKVLGDKWIEAAHRRIRQNDEPAEARSVSYVYLFEAFFPADQAKQNQWLEIASTMGDENAAYDLGDYYARTDNEGHDYQKAFHYFNLADDRGNPQAAERIGRLYLDGNGVEQDFEKAKSYFNKAIAKGWEHAKMELAQMHLNGQGFPKDPSKAISIYEEHAAEDRIGSAELELGRIYFEGKVVSKDLAKAREWFEIAKQEGQPSADYYLDEIAYELKNKRD